MRAFLQRFDRVVMDAMQIQVKKTNQLPCMSALQTAIFNKYINAQSVEDKTEMST